ncbi:MAG: polysaccharide deacetylase family protein [Selenomonadaceae bacterium]|nr:polysaccharide deacetylase family protein [Selenomonadaceae bacterium]
MLIRCRKVFFIIALVVLLGGAGLLGWLLFTPSPGGIPVLEYHMVTMHPKENAEAYNVPPEDFAGQLDYLAEQGYTTITMLEFMKARKGKLELPKKPIILTFDDGYDDNYYEMLPILEAHGMKAVVYMVTNMIGQPGYLTWEQLREMQNRGVEIGSHTANHVPLTELSPEERNDELKLSKLILEWNGIKTVFSLSYPNGKYDDSLPGLLKENEYLTAVTGDAGLNTFQTNPYLMQRVNILDSPFGITAFKIRLLKAELMTRLGWRQHLEEND